MSSAAFVVDVWNTGQVFTSAGNRAEGREGSLQFRNAFRVDTVSRDGQPWTVLWTRVGWEAAVGHLSVLSVLCTSGQAALSPAP